MGIVKYKCPECGTIVSEDAETINWGSHAACEKCGGVYRKGSCVIHLEELNILAMERMESGYFGAVPSFCNVVRHMADILNDTGSEEVVQTLSFHDKEEGLIPEVTIRVRKPKEEL